MPYPALPPEKRLIAASLSGEISRLSLGTLDHLPREQKLERLWAVTRDPQILGHALGPYLAEPRPHEGTAAAIDLLRAAGADEAEAERNAEWQRERLERERGGPRS